MAFLGRMFGGGGGGGAKKAAPSSAQTTEQLGNTVDLIEKREAVLQKKIDGEVEKAKGLLAKKTPAAKQQAMACMKRKKMYEDQLNLLGQQKLNMEHTKAHVENSAITMEIAKTTAVTAQHMKAEQAKLNVDKIDQIRDDMQEAMDTAQEVSNMLAEPMGDQADDDELLAELEGLEEEQLSAEIMGVGAATQELPAVPNAPMPAQAAAKKDEDEDALAQLEADLA